MNGHALTCPAGYREGERCECIHKLGEKHKMDYAAFHASEFDAPPADGWYICAVVGDGPISDNCSGPYTTEADALAALRSGAWLTDTVAP